MVAAFEIAAWCQGKGLKAHPMALGGAHSFPFGWVKLVPAAHGTLFEEDHREPRPCQLSCHDTTRRAGTDNYEVHHLGVPIQLCAPSALTRSLTTPG